MLVLLRRVAAALSLLVLIAPLVFFRSPAVFAGNACSTKPENLTHNGSMAGGYDTRYGTVGNDWTPFVLAGNPHFDLVDNENANGDDGGPYSQYISADQQHFDAGLFQVVHGLHSGVFYNFWAGFALAARDNGNGGNVRVNSIGRQVGVDPTGGTDPQGGSVQWGLQYFSGGPALNIAALNITFAARGDQATVFVRGFNQDTGARDKIWFDVLCMRARDDLPTATPAAPTATSTATVTNTPTAAPTRTATAIPRAVAAQAAGVQAPLPTATETQLPPTATRTATKPPPVATRLAVAIEAAPPTAEAADTARPRRLIPAADSPNTTTEVKGTTLSVEPGYILGGLGLAAISGSFFLLLATATWWWFHRH